MKIFKSPLIETIISDYNYLDHNYRSVATLIAFKLSTGKLIDNISEAIAKVYEKFPNVIIDHGMPKPIAEWSIQGSVYKNISSQYSLVNIKVGELEKNVLVDFKDLSHVSIPLNDANFNKYFFQYDRKTKEIIKPITNSFCELGELDPQRLAFAGSYDESTWLKLPKDFNYSFDNTAPIDQRQNKPWQFGNSYSLNGVTANGEELSSTIPAFYQAILMHRFEKDGQSSLITSNTNFDTIKFFPDCDLGIMVFHSLFEVDQAKDFDSLLCLDLRDYCQIKENEPNQEINFDPNICIKIIQDLHKKEQKAETPIYQIHRQVEKIYKESRKVKHRRYCNVYMDYYRYLSICEEIPLLQPLEKDRLKRFIDEFPTDLSSYEPNQKERLNAVRASIEQQIKAHDQSFHAQVSAFLDYCQQFNEEPAFLEWLNKYELSRFSQKLYFISYLPQSITRSYKDFSIEEEGTFTIPAGLVVPSYVGEQFIACAIFSLEDPSKPIFVLPGSTQNTTFSWFNILREQFNITVLHTSITDALRLNEETYHYLGHFYMNDPKQKLSEELENNLNNADFILLPVTNEQEEEMQKLWNERFSNLITIPLGEDQQNHKAFNTLSERIYSNESIEEWLQPYFPFQITEPNYLSDEQYTGAIQHAMGKHMKLTPGKFDFDDAKDRVLEEERQKALAFCKTPEIRKEVNAAYDRAKVELHNNNKMTEEQIMDKYFETQEDTIKYLEKNMLAHADDMKKYTPFDDPKKVIDFLTADLAKQKLNYKRFKAIKESSEATIAQVQKEREEEQRKKFEVVEKEHNLNPDDLVFLKQIEHYENEELYINQRDYSGLDLSKLQLKNSTFDRVKFCNCDLSLVDFSGSVFNECDFTGATLRMSKWNNVTLTLCTAKDLILEQGEINNTQVLGGEISNFSIRDTAIKNVTFSTTKIDQLELEKVKAESLSFEFNELKNSRFNDSIFKNLNFTQTNIENTELSENKITHFDIKDSRSNKITILNSNIERFNINGSQLAFLEFIKSHMLNMNIDESELKNTKGNQNIYEELYISQSDLSGSDFSYSIMKNSYITESVMQKINFEHANLFMSNLTKNHFGFTNFKEANLFSSDFKDSKFKDNNFESANLKRTALHNITDFI